MNMTVKAHKVRWYGAGDSSCDPEFRELIYNAVGPESRVLDAGAGCGERFQYDLKGRVREVVGLDLDLRVERNAQLDRGIIGDLSRIPVEANYFDLVFSRYVLEHIDDPAAVLTEVNRVLVPGGRFLFVTPNRLHYIAMASLCTPHWFHGWFNSRLRGRSEEDTFPTRYRLNSVRTLNRQLCRYGFEKEFVMLRETAPNYLMWSLPAFYLGLVYERLVNATELLAGFRVSIVGCFRKVENTSRSTER